MAYKKDISDIRESPALDVIRLLQLEGAEVAYSDPYAPELHLDGVSLRSQELTPETVRGHDCVVVVTDHTGVDFDMIAKEAALVVDCRNAIRSQAPNVIKL